MMFGLPPGGGPPGGGGGPAPWGRKKGAGGALFDGAEAIGLCHAMFAPPTADTALG